MTLANRFKLKTALNQRSQINCVVFNYYIFNIMDTRKRQRSIYVTAKQKKKLIELMVKHPELISCKVTQEFNYRDSQKLWHNIAHECNSIPGARKTWRQWRKTWQDIRSNTKKQQVLTNGELPPSMTTLTLAEQEALGLKNLSSTSFQEATEFIPLEQDNVQLEDSFNNEMESNPTFSDSESPPEIKVFTRSQGHKMSKLNSKKNNGPKQTNNCFFNCDVLAVQEQRKIQLKEDYLNFKKDYLRQKLILIKEQTEALKNIAKELSK